MLDIIKKHLEAYAQEDWETYKKGFTNEAVYIEMATQQRESGRDGITRLVQRWKTAFPDLRAAIKNSVIGPDKLVVEVEWTGTHEGVLDGPFGRLEPTGQRGSVAGALVITMKNGKISEMHHYFDLMTVLMQAGMGAPRAEGAGAPAVH